MLAEPSGHQDRQGRPGSGRRTAGTTPLAHLGHWVAASGADYFLFLTRHPVAKC